MGQPFVPGPVPLWIAFGTIPGTPLFLGVSTRGISISFDPEYVPLVTDISGSVPLDYSYAGCGAVIQASLPAWDEIVYSQISDYAGIVPGSVRGEDRFGEIGTLMGFEGASMHLYLPFPYQQKLAYQNMIQGMHFFATFLERDTLPERGTRPATLDLVFRAIRQPVVNVNGVVGASLFRLYDHDVSAVSNLPYTFYSV